MVVLLLLGLVCVCVDFDCWCIDFGFVGFVWLVVVVV